MDINNLGDIVVNHVDLTIINNAIKQRAEALGGQLNADAAAQFISDMSQIECSVESNGTGLVFNTKLSDSYLLNYLKNHTTPVSGGEGGEAHNVDGSTYESGVPYQLQGTPLPWYELPTVEGQDEANKVVEIMASDASRAAVNSSLPEIESEVVMPYVREHLFGGG